MDYIIFILRSLVDWQIADTVYLQWSVPSDALLQGTVPWHNVPTTPISSVNVMNARARNASKVRLVQLCLDSVLYIHIDYINRVYCILKLIRGNIGCKIDASEWLPIKHVEQTQYIHIIYKSYKHIFTAKLKFNHRCIIKRHACLS